MPLGTAIWSGITQRDKCHTIRLTHGIETRHERTNPRNGHIITENRLLVAKGREAEVSRCKLLYREWMSNKVLLHSTENGVQYSVKTHHGKNTHTHMTAEINTALLTNYTSIFLNQKNKDKNKTMPISVHLMVHLTALSCAVKACPTCHAASSRGMTPSLAVPRNTLILQKPDLCFLPAG